MSYWNAKHTNDHGEYEVTFGTKYRDRARAVEKVCQAVIDMKVKSPEDVFFGLQNPQWISVEKRLPTKDDANPRDSVIAIDKTDGFARSWWYEIVARYPQEFTHWMPLPKPPREEE